MTTFLLVRHGDTDALGAVLAGSTPGWKLNPQGRQQVKEISRQLSHLPLRVIYTSPLERTVETAHAIAEPHGLSPIVREQLIEAGFGKWQGKRFDELCQDSDWNRFNAARSLVRPPDGELMIDTQARMVRELEAMRVRHPGELVAVVSHCDPIRLLLAHYLGSPIELLLRFQISPASVSAVHFIDNSVSIGFLNRTGEVSL